MSGIIIAPFSNSPIRNWPEEHFAALIGLLLDRLDEEVPIRITGTQGQRLAANEIVRDFPATRVFNACGRMSWPQVIEAVRTADCVIGNNSGVSHLSSHLGTPTVCVFGGSHQRHEWRPLGANVILLSRAIGCSPCQLDHGSFSPYRKACLRQIEPQVVADAAFAIMEKVAAQGRTAAPSAAPVQTRFGGSLV